jgi:hypothetical protein
MNTSASRLAASATERHSEGLRLYALGCFEEAAREIEAAFRDSPSSELANDWGALLSPLGELTGAFTWFEPDFAELVRTLRHVYEHREEAAQRGLLAAKHVRQHFGWPHVTQIYMDRVGLLMKPQTRTHTSSLIWRLARKSDKRCAEAWSNSIAVRVGCLCLPPFCGRAKHLNEAKRYES